MSVVKSRLVSDKKVSLSSDRVVYVTEDNLYLGKAIVTELKLRRIEAGLISLDNLQKRQHPASGLIILPQINPSNKNSDYFWDKEREFLLKAFELSKEIGQELIESSNLDKGGAILAGLSRIDGTLGFIRNKISNPVQGGIAGLIKTASLEWDKVCCHAIDIDPAWNDNETIAKAVVDEIFSYGPIEIGLTSDSRYIFELENAPFPKGQINLNKEDVIVITGGARGVTAECAYALASCVQGTIVLLGRSPAPTPDPSWLQNLTVDAEIKKAILVNHFAGQPVSPVQLEKEYKQYIANREVNKNIEKIKSTGAKAFYFSVDVTNEENIKKIISDIINQYGQIKCLVHGAGVLEDKFILDKTLDQFKKVFDTKVYGLKNLLRALSNQPLSYIVLFSSVTARHGNKGQVDYAVANEVLNKVAQSEALKRKSCKVISINWGPWDGGMVNSSLKKEFEKNNIKLISMEDGANAMVAEMSGDFSEPVEVVIGATMQIEKEKKREKNNFEFEISLDLCPVLKAHKLGDKPVVPFALIMEWIANSAMVNKSGLIFHGIDGMRLLNGIKLENKKENIAVIAARTEKEGAFFKVATEVKKETKNGYWVIHAKGGVILTNTLPFAPAYSLSDDIAETPYQRTIADAYEKVLFHGKLLQCIKEVIGFSIKGMAVKTLSHSTINEWITNLDIDKWLLNPLVLDCAFQTAILWCYENTGKVCLPTYFESYRQYKNSFPEDEVICVFEVKDLKEHKLIGDFIFIDSDKSVIGIMSGYEAIIDSSLMDAFNKGRSIL
ncbi:MAG: SDR family NAD(P)-dependent oxidoreductase [Desulfobacterales bacterium]|nr:SDR family NAD(P)-dependent oxidoreductase [Desulfobacterales bacterium]